MALPGAEQLAAVSVVVLDLDGVQFMGSAGLSVLFGPTNA
jgi:anti-anti-sigma factor